MGLAASQARALLLVARKSDLEYRSQCLTQRKMVLAQQTEQLARDYSNKISNRKLSFVYNIDGSSGETKTEDLTYFSLKNNAKFVGDYRVLDSFGNIVVASINEIPKATKEVPVYTKVKTGDDGKVTAVSKTEETYTQVTTELGKSSGTDKDNKAIYPEIYLPSYNLKENKIEYKKIQNTDGTLETNQKIVLSDGTEMSVFKYIGEGTESNDTEKTLSNYQLVSDLEKYNRYKKVLTSSFDTTTDFNSAAEAQAAGYQQINGQTTKVEVDRQPAADGYYYSDDGRRYVVAPEIAYKSYFQNGLRNGALTLEQASTVDQKDSLGNKIGEVTSWNSTPWQGLSIIQDSYDTSDDAQAESDYEAKTAALKAQDQMLDMEIKQIETQHKAVETEWDSVKKIIEGNIDKTFKIFA